MGLFEKKRCRNFFIYVQNFSEEDKKTWKAFDVMTQTSADLYKKFGLEENTIDFIGHAVAMYRDDDYL